MEREFPVDELLAAWSKGWTSADAEGLADLWDREYNGITFLPTERDDAIRRPPCALYAWDGAGEVKPFQEAGTRIIEGVY